MPSGRLPQVLAANGAITTVAGPAGTAVGGLLVSTAGSQATLLLSSTSILALGFVGIAIAALRHQGVLVRQDLPEES